MLLVEEGKIGLSVTLCPSILPTGLVGGGTIRELLSHTAGFTDYPKDFDLRKDYSEDKASGEYFGDFLRERVFKPLGMSTTRIVDEADVIPNRAAGYRLENGQLKNQNWVAPSANRTADGSLYFSILDLAKWDAALYTDKLLEASSRQAMWTVATLRDGKPNPAHYGFGWLLKCVTGTVS